MIGFAIVSPIFLTLEMMGEGDEMNNFVKKKKTTRNRKSLL